MWRRLRFQATPRGSATNSPVGAAVFAPLVRGGKRWATQISTALGVEICVWSTVGVFFVSDEEDEMAPGVPAVAGPGVAAALGALIVVFSRRAYRE